MLVNDMMRCPQCGKPMKNCICDGMTYPGSESSNTTSEKSYAMSKLQETLAMVLDTHQPFWPAPDEHPGYIACTCMAWADSLDTMVEAEDSHRAHVAGGQASAVWEVMYSEMEYIAECGHFVPLDIVELDEGGWEVLLLEAGK